MSEVLSGLRMVPCSLFISDSAAAALVLASSICSEGDLNWLADLSEVCRWKSCGSCGLAGAGGADRRRHFTGRGEADTCMCVHVSGKEGCRNQQGSLDLTVHT